MFKAIIQKLNEMRAERKARARRIRAYKKAEIRGALIDYFNDLDATEGTVNTPAFMRADEKMQEVIKTDKDLDYFYNKLRKYKKVIATY